MMMMMMMMMMNRYGDNWNGERTVFCDQFGGWKDSCLGVMRGRKLFSDGLTGEGRGMEWNADVVDNVIVCSTQIYVVSCNK